MKQEEELGKVQHYRDLAAHLRGLAQADENPETRAKLLSVAESYDQLRLNFMERAERRDDSTVVKFRR